jgi:hypothetical protein
LSACLWISSKLWPAAGEEKPKNRKLRINAVTLADTADLALNIKSPFFNG